MAKQRLYSSMHYSLAVAGLVTAMALLTAVPSSALTGDASRSGPSSETIAASAAWSTVQVPLPANDNNTLLGTDFMVCPAAGSCVLSGQYETTSDALAVYADTLSGGTWSTVQVALPANDNNSRLSVNFMACPAAGSCAIAGQYTTTSGTLAAFLDTLSSGTWTDVQAPLPANDNNTLLGTTFMNCPAAGSCVLSGQYKTTTGALAVYADTLSG
jgi:hypothetical protein